MKSVSHLCFEHSEIYFDSVKRQLSHNRIIFLFLWEHNEFTAVKYGCKNLIRSSAGDWVLPARAGNQAIFTYVIKEIFQTALSEREREILFELLNWKNVSRQKSNENR